MTPAPPPCSIAAPDIHRSGVGARHHLDERREPRLVTDMALDRRWWRIGWPIGEYLAPE